MKTYRHVLAAVALSVVALPASAQIVATDANDIAVTNTAPFGTLVQAIGTATIANGLDFTFGNREGVFDDGGGVDAICGVTAGGNCNLVTAVDGRIVVRNTVDQGLTNFIFAEAGFAANNALTLEVFGIDNTLLASAGLSTAALGPNGRGTASISRALFDIAYFRISGADAFGVNLIRIETPLAAVAGVPEPASWALMIAGIGMVGGVARRRRSVSVRYA